MIIEDYFLTPFSYRIQKTLRSPLRFNGLGLHSGAPTWIEICPAPPNFGLVFQRVDQAHPMQIPATHEHVVATDMATTIGIKENPNTHIGTVEHLLSSLFAMGITNALINVGGPEIPILDGSSGSYVEAFLKAQVQIQPFSTKTLRIHKPIRTYKNGAACEFLPRDRLRITTSINFTHPQIGPQTYAVELTPKLFLDQISTAKTFGFIDDLEKLQKLNLAQGASLENVLAFSKTELINPEQQTYKDECVRHKILDAIGDLALCGCWIEGELVSFKGGHSLHLALLQSLSEHPDAWEVLPAEPLTHLPKLNQGPITLDLAQAPRG